MAAPERWELVFEQINGMLAYDIPGVKNEAEMDGLIGPLVEDICQARVRLSARAGLELGTDADLQQLVRRYEQLCRVCGRLMYHYGLHDGQGRGTA